MVHALLKRIFSEKQTNYSGGLQNNLLSKQMLPRNVTFSCEPHWTKRKAYTYSLAD